SLPPAGPGPGPPPWEAGAESPALALAFALALALLRSPRQMDAEHRAAVRRVIRRDAAAVQLDDAPRDRQPEPGPVRARGEERVEDAVAVLGGQAGAVVADRDDQLAALPCHAR